MFQGLCNAALRLDTSLYAFEGYWYFMTIDELLIISVLTWSHAKNFQLSINLFPLQVYLCELESIFDSRVPSFAAPCSCFLF